MTIFSSFSANFPPHYHTILAINSVHASNWFTHLQRTGRIDGQNDNSVLTVSHLPTSKQIALSACCYSLGHKKVVSRTRTMAGELNGIPL